MPLPVSAAGYTVRQGDSLGLIAQRYGVSVPWLAQANNIPNPNYIQAGTLIQVPGTTGASTGSYRVAWGDTLLGIANRYGVSVQQIRALNPSLGRFPIAGQSLNLCSSCGASTSTGTVAASGVSSGTTTSYTVQAGDTLSEIASSHGISTASLMATNGLSDADHIVIGSQLTLPGGGATTASAPVANEPSQIRSLIVSYAQAYGVDPAFALAIGYQESTFDESKVSYTGAVGVMQVEPYTAVTISKYLGKRVNIYDITDNVQAGVFWLSHLLRYYGGDERMASAAYYQGTSSIKRRGFYQDTIQYVSRIASLRSNFAS